MCCRFCSYCTEVSHSSVYTQECRGEAHVAMHMCTSSYQKDIQNLEKQESGNDRFQVISSVTHTKIKA